MNEFRFNKEVPFMYFLFNWGIPIFVSWHLLGCVEYARRISEKWSDVLPSGSITCKAFRPGGEPGVDFQEVDYTESLLKALSHD